VSKAPRTASARDVTDRPGVLLRPAIAPPGFRPSEAIAWAA
jgi:hypothetical protein